MIQHFQEITTHEDSYGKRKDSKGRITLTATRSFLIQIDTSMDRSIDEVHSKLPKIGDAHPYILNCFVIDIKVNNRENDPYIYLAKVEYESSEPTDMAIKPNPEDHLEEQDIKYPWDNPAIVTMSSDTSQTQAMELAFTKWPVLPNDLPPDQVVASKPKQEANFPAFPILNEPFKEKFASIPEEPTGCLALDINFALKGYEGLKFRRHSRQIVLDLKAEYFTVNNIAVTLFGYTFQPYCGYVAGITMESKYFLSDRGGIYAYYDVRLRIIDNPRTWVRRVLNVSFNTYKVDPVTEEMTKSHIMLKDAYTGLTSKITEPVPIHPVEGTPLTIDDKGLPKLDTEVTPYVLPFLTKPPSGWQELRRICNAVDARV